MIENSVFPDSLKQTGIKTKKIPGMKKKNTGLQVSYPTYLKFMNVACIQDEQVF